MADADFVDLEEGSGETGEISNVCLVGKVLGTKMFNGPVVFNILTAVWKTRASFTVTPWNNNIFLFRFEEEEDRRFVLQEGPWSVMNNLLVLTPLKDGTVVEQMDFSKCHFWVQIHGLPIEKMSRTNAEIIGRRFGRLLAIETSPDNILLARSFLRVKVEINIDQPLPKGFWIRRKKPESKDLWISYKYEKLQDFCYACGRIGHESRGCRFVTREEVDEAEIRVENLLARRPVFQRSGMDARVVNDVGACVTPPVVQQNQRTNGGVVVPHSSSITVHGTDVMQSRGTGISENIPLLSSSQDLSYADPLNSNAVKSGHGSDPPIPHAPPIFVIPSLIPRGPNHNNLQISDHSPVYFVTEPAESPKSTPNSPPLSPQTTETQVYNFADLTSPSKTKEITKALNPYHPSPKFSLPQIEKPSSPKFPDIALATVFQSLAIKRKATEDQEEQGKSKILRLCTPEIPSPKTQARPTRATRRILKGRQSPKSPSKGNGSTGNSFTMEQDMCDVQIQQSYDCTGMELAVAPMGMSIATDDKGRVAGPKQPPSQC
ncbi:hypothetical protein RHSIM_Rhsim03G0009600 [Rhododendron simsii]|uniref:CCHC-type domain-containing protein n=1 Tax=Rhododendron simsii TaxID=118357 RepID=A0A834LQZ1_RHOSS|nr:hypothetical protein RHSIM_Rhsim03G0009600 [Rhododendron simsii]